MQLNTSFFVTDEPPSVSKTLKKDPSITSVKKTAIQNVETLYPLVDQNILAKLPQD
jgi:hypothetical protein